MIGHSAARRECCTSSAGRRAHIVPAIILLACIFSTASASAQTLAGTITNGTTKKAAVGDDVVLIKLGQGMEEAGRTKTDANGAFRFKLDDSGPHLIRAIHQGVTKKIEGISVTADVMRFQALGNELQGIRLFAVDN